MEFINNIPKEYQSIIDKITKVAIANNYTIYAVGGFVRDMILNRQPKDLDIMVEGDNAGIKFANLLSEQLNIHSPVIFEKFATAKLIIDDHEIEFIMPRQEYYDKNSRNPRTEKATLVQDVLRRDFTVNALFLRLNDMALLDLCGKGLQDINDKIIRVTDETASDLIFEQDPLRILRAVRQSFQLGFTIEKSTYQSMVKKSNRITIVSPERIRDEINKILLLDKPSKAFYMLDDINLLEIIFPELKRMQNIEYSQNNDVFIHIMNVIDKVKPDLLLRVASLMHYTGKIIKIVNYEEDSVKITKNILVRLKYSTNFIKDVISLIEDFMLVKKYNLDWSDTDVRRFEKQVSKNLKDIELLAIANAEKYNSSLFDRIKKLENQNMLAPKEELLDGNELVKILGYPSGKWIGSAKKYIEELQFENPSISMEKAIEKLKIYIEKSKDILL
ncbi:MAG: hypothetical protein PHT81_01090 [Endomicrobiaceae bacterium]|nr:hypothetical protein [Endomicrobiaceae bacterium]